MLKEQRKILIVEDEEILAELYTKKFSNKGFLVAWAQNGMQALDVAKTFCPDVILLDLVMPHLNGWDALNFFKSNESTGSALIVIFSNLPREDNEIRALEMGAAAFFPKTKYTPQELVSAIGKLLNK